MIFPDWENLLETAQAEVELPLFAEWAVDWETGGFALRDGKPYTVTTNKNITITQTGNGHISIKN